MRMRDRANQYTSPAPLEPNCTSIRQERRRNLFRNALARMERLAVPRSKKRSMAKDLAKLVWKGKVSL